MNEKENSSSRRFIVSGKVQGVFFRASTKKEADRLGLKGYAKNLQSGQVEVLAQGSAKATEELRVWLHEGSDYCHVESVVEVDGESVEVLGAFNSL